MLQIDSGRNSRDEKLPDLRRRTELRKRLLNTPDALSADDLRTTRGRRNSHGERLVPTGEQFRPDVDQKRKKNRRDPQKPGIDSRARFVSNATCIDGGPVAGSDGVEYEAAI